MKSAHKKPIAIMNRKDHIDVLLRQLQEKLSAFQEYRNKVSKKLALSLDSDSIAGPIISKRNECVKVIDGLKEYDSKLFPDTVEGELPDDMLVSEIAGIVKDALSKVLGVDVIGEPGFKKKLSTLGAKVFEDIENVQRPAGQKDMISEFLSQLEEENWLRAGTICSYLTNLFESEKFRNIHSKEEIDTFLSTLTKRRVYVYMARAEEYLQPGNIDGASQGPDVLNARKYFVHAKTKLDLLTEGNIAREIKQAEKHRANKDIPSEMELQLAYKGKQLEKQLARCDDRIHAGLKRCGV